MRVLVIESDSIAVSEIELTLRSEGFDVSTASLGQAGIDQAKLDGYDMILTEMRLPDMGGSEVIESLRHSKVQTPLIVLSADVRVDTKVEALNLGADDYITKPFYKSELIARIRAVIRRSRTHDDIVFNIGRLTVKTASRTVEIDGKRVLVTEREYRLLRLLAEHEGQPVSSTYLLLNLWSEQQEATEQALRSLVSRTRAALSLTLDAEEYVHNILGFGYMLKAPVAKAIVA